MNKICFSVFWAVIYVYKCVYVCNSIQLKADSKTNTVIE